MIKGGPYERRESKQEDTSAQVGGKDGGAGTGSRTAGPVGGLQTRGDCAGAVVAVEAEVHPERNCRFKGDQTWSEGCGGSGCDGVKGGDGAAISGAIGDFDRTPSDEKKETLNVEGPLYGRHLSKNQRESLIEFIDGARASKSLTAICEALELRPRAYYRWKSSMREHHGGGRNKITPLEEQRVVALAKKFPDWHCRRIAYHLEKRAQVFIGKTRVAEIMKSHGLNHAFERRKSTPQIVPADMLLHEPWAKNYLWGMDWTWVNVNDKFMFLLVLLDWYSRKILSWGLYHQITQFEVVSVVTDAVAIEEIDLLPMNRLRPIVVADHGSANCAKYTKANIEIQGLQLWLSGIGRPTGNARTERVIGTLKREEINLQEQYTNEVEAKQRIGTTIWDYNINRPNQGNGGFAPNSVHHMGRWELMKRRERARQKARELRIKHWEQEPSPSTQLLLT